MAPAAGPGREGHLTVNEEQNLPTLIVQAQHVRGVQEPDQPQVFQQRVNRGGPVTRRAPHRVAITNANAGVCARQDLPGPHVVHG
jgi:hypothetical protein